MPEAQEQPKPEVVVAQKYDPLVDEIIAFLKKNGGSATKTDILANFKKVPHEKVNYLLCKHCAPFGENRTPLLTASREDEAKVYSLFA